MADRTTLQIDLPKIPSNDEFMDWRGKVLTNARAEAARIGLKPYEEKMESAVG